MASAASDGGAGGDVRALVSGRRPRAPVSPNKTILRGDLRKKKKKINEYLTLRSIQSVVGETTTNVYKTRHCAFQGYRRTSQGSGRRESARPGFPTITLSAP